MSVAAVETGFFGTTVGKKVVMAVTGVILFGFVVGHMIGNLQVFLGPEALDHYAVFLREFGHGGALWIARATLLTSVVLHIWAATSLALTSTAARPIGYRQKAWRESTYASRTMRWSGPIILLFVIYHLLHFTFGTVHPNFVPGSVYHNVITGFQSLQVSLFYILAQLALGLHLYHGIWSMLHTLGLSHPQYDRLRSAFSTLFTLIVVVGNISIPVAVLTGAVK
jgi:succinate dehydrogenase / fumarate reductase, cytochrome b subunit